MLNTGIILLAIASIIRGWGILNHRRDSVEAAAAGSGSSLAIISILSIGLALLGAILIGVDTSFWVSLIVFAAFWFLSRIWIPILSLFGF